MSASVYQFTNINFSFLPSIRRRDALNRHYLLLSQSLFCLWLALIAPNAFAQDEIVRSPFPDLELGLISMNFHYKEFDENNQILDKEDGTIPGIMLGMREYDGPWVYASNLSYYAGNVVYDGQAVSLSSGAITPLIARTDEKIYDFTVLAEHWYRNSNNQSRFAWYAGIGYRYWIRDILPGMTSSGTPVSGLVETYKWWYAIGGVKNVLIDSGNFQLLLDARITRTYRPVMKVDFFETGDETILNLKERYGGRVSMPLHYRLNHTATVKVEPYMEGLAFGRSEAKEVLMNGVPSGQSILEPRSETRNTGVVLSVNLSY